MFSIIPVLISGLLFCNIFAQDTSNECQLRGFSGAKLNKCGYCVEGTTGLPGDFGIDCAGTCGLAFTDCSGKCNGDSYWDECSGECISGNVLTVIPTSEATVTTDKSFHKQRRDCRQLCSLQQPNNVSSLNYTADSCGVCIVQSKEEPVIVTQPPVTVTPQLENVTSESENVTEQQDILGTTFLSDTTNAFHKTTTLNPSNKTARPSAYLDCTGTCYAPATVDQMATVSNDSCNQCVGPHTATKKESLLNPCGRCIPDPITCLCPKAEQDMCGVCSGQNDTCKMIASGFPTTIPSNILTKVNVVGVTLKSKYHSVCLLIREDVQSDGKDEEKFPADVLGTNIVCYIKAPEGIYRLHVGVTLANGEVLEYSNSSLPFIIYSNAASIDSMSPSAVTIPKVNASEVQVTFAARNTQKIDRIFCTIYGGEYQIPVVVTSRDVSANRASCHLPYPLHSTSAYVNVSFDGNQTVAGPFRITFYASPPNITYFLPLPEGDSVVVFFDRDVSISNLTNCSRIFTEDSMSTTLGQNATCIWVTKRQLMVTLDTRSNVRQTARPSSSLAQNVTTNETSNEEISSSFFHPSSSNDVVILNFKDKTLYHDGEMYADSASKLSVAFSLADELPVAVLVGPTQVPPCGDFLMDGHQSTGLQSRRARYIWKVTADVPSNITGDAAVSKNLQDLVNKATSENSASIVVESTDLEYRVMYTFSMTVSNGDVLNGAASSTASLTVIQSYMDVPVVIIEPSIASYNNKIDIHRRFTFHAHLDTPTCLKELYSIHFRWSTSNPRIKFDVQQMNSTSYTVEPYSLYPNENVTFSVEVWLNNNRNISSRSSVSFQTALSTVRAIVSGGTERTVGSTNSSTLLTLNASQSYHVVTPNVPLVYRWECLEQDLNPCYNYDTNVKEILLVEKPITRDSVLSIPISRLRAGSLLKFNVQAFSPLNATEISETQTVKVFVVNGTSPMVTIDSVVPEDNSKNVPEVFDLLHQIPSESNVKVVASIHSLYRIASVKWNITGFIKDLAPYSLSETIDEHQSQVTLIIRKDYVVPNGLYEVNLTVTNERGELGWAMAFFTVMRPITNCRVVVPDYEPFKMTYVYVDSCSTSHQNYPLRYQVFVHYKGCPMSLNAPEYHLPMAIMGPPMLPTNSDSNNYSNVFSVKVCTVLDSCWWFNSSQVNVLSTTDMQAAAEHAFAMANIGKLTSDYLACLRRHSFYLMAITPSYRNENEIEFESQLAQAFICGRRAAEVQCRDAECFANLFSFLTAFPIDSKTSREFMMTEVMDRAMERIEERNLTLNAIGVQEAFIVLETVYRFNVSDVDMAKTVSTLEGRFQRILARSLQMGESPLLTDAQGHPVVAMQYNSLNTTLKVVTNSTGNSTVILDFSNELKQTYDTWTCKPDGSLCRGVVAQMQFYPETGYRPVDVDIKNTVSEVISVALLNPSTGDFVETKSGKGQALTLLVPVDRERMDKSLSYDCYYWNENDQKWSTNGVETVDNGAQEMRCDSDRLATFAIIGSKPKLSAGIIAAIVVSVVVLLALLAGGAFFFYRKSRTKTMRVSISKGYHPNGQ